MLGQKTYGAIRDFEMWLIQQRGRLDSAKSSGVRRAFTAVKTLTFLRNTLIVSLGSLIGELLTASLAAYGFARLRFPGRDVLFVLMLSTLMLPYIVTLIPLFILFRTLGWINTLLPLIVPAYFGGHPLYIFLLRQTYLGLPRELDDAAKIDGAGFFRIWWSVLMPLTRPALATVAILSLVFHWNDFVARKVIPTNAEAAIKDKVGF